jgi:hypothetical protein
LYRLVWVQFDAFEIQLNDCNEVLSAIDVVWHCRDIRGGRSTGSPHLLYKRGLAHAFGANDCNVDRLHDVLGVVKLGQ